MKRILLVEDDRNLGATLKERLQKENYFVAWAQTAESTLKILGQEAFDLIIFDVTLPDGDGFQLAEELKTNLKLNTPFLFMTARSEAENRLRGYELGAVEFIPKPFHLKELLLRLEHVLENHTTNDLVLYGDFEIDLKAMQIRGAVSGEVIELGTRDFQVLALLIRMTPKVVTRDEILNQIWGEDHFPSPRTVDNAIVRLRSVLGDETGSVIRSVRGLGYQWQA